MLIEQRRQLARELREQGRTVAVIAAELGVAPYTVRLDLRQPVEHVPQAEREQAAIHADAERRLEELRRVKRYLWRDRADPVVQAELAMIQSAIACAERALQDA